MGNGLLRLRASGTTGTSVGGRAPAAGARSGGGVDGSSRSGANLSRSCEVVPWPSGSGAGAAARDVSSRSGEKPSSRAGAFTTMTWPHALHLIL